MLVEEISRKNLSKYRQKISMLKILLKI